MDWARWVQRLESAGHVDAARRYLCSGILSGGLGLPHVGRSQESLLEGGVERQEEEEEEAPSPKPEFASVSSSLRICSWACARCIYKLALNRGRGSARECEGVRGSALGTGQTEETAWGQRGASVA
jgi:hypothetical protein